MRTSPTVLWAFGLLLAAPAAAQDLRRGLVDADAVFVGSQLGKKPFGDALVLHRVQVRAAVRGLDGDKSVTVLDWPKLSLHNRPVPRQQRLFCVEDASAIATRLGLPQSEGPYYKLVGWAGSHPMVAGDVDANAAVRFARVLADAERGTATATTAEALCAMALGADAPVGAEVATFLAERPDLRGKLSSVQWSQLVARASGEIEDIELKIALAELCCEQRLEGLLDALAVSLGPVTDVRFARCVGRIGKVLYGEQATGRLMERLRMAGQDKDRRMLLLAIGATSTQSALDALMQMSDKDAAVTAALQEHRSPTAREAARRRR